jgi:hypothetical protein
MSQNKLELMGSDMENAVCQAVFDGHVFRPTEKISLSLDKKYLLRIQEIPLNENELNPIDILDSLTGTLEGPEDWAINHDKYLYGMFDNSVRQADSSRGGLQRPNEFGRIA